MTLSEQRRRDVSSDQTLADPRVLENRYRIDDLLATGGMGAVHAGWDERLERPVAIKMPKESMALTPNAVERFRREAHAVAALSHPNIASIFDYGEHRNAPFIVMELIDGRDLARVLHDDGQLPVERATWVAVQVCAALACAHSHGIIHRDIKPANIIVCSDDRVKVTDFGIARALGDSTLTATGSVFGTPQYISPEQALGERLTHLTDIYSLGVVLYEMLTGSAPFQGESPLAIAMRHVNDDLPAPSELNPEVPAQLDSMVATATARAPQDRYASCAEMAEALKDVLPDGSAMLKASQALTIPVAPKDQNATTPLSEEAEARLTTAPRKRPRWRNSIYRLPRRLRLVLAAASAFVVAVALILALQGGPEQSRRETPRDRSGTSGDPLPNPLERELRELEEVVKP